MAKSSRSKIKRANRALKRQKNSVKETAKLEKMLQQAKESLGTNDDKKSYTILGEPATEQEEAMAVDGEEKTTKAGDVEEVEEEIPMGVGSRTKSGNFPIWMNKRAIKKAKALERKKSRNKTKAKRAGARPWRK